METKNLTYMPRMDVLRFIAAAIVIVYHVYEWGPKWDGKYIPDIWNLIFIRGSAGVSLFMVMSGYLMAQIFMKYPHATYREFIINRFVRVAPLGLLLLLGGIAANDGGDVSRKVISALTLQFNVDRSGMIAPLWTIATEFQFYLVVPFLAAMVARSGLSTLVKLTIFIGVFRILLMVHTMRNEDFAFNTAYYSLIGRFDQFALGMILAYLPLNWSKLFRNPIHVVGSVIMLMLLFFGAAVNPWWDRNLFQVLIQSGYLTAEGIACGYFMLAFMNTSIKIPFERQLAYLGAASYSMYLLHEIIVRQYLALFPANLIGLRIDAILIILPVVTAVSVFSYEFFEKPFLSFRKEYSKSPQQ
jgi:Predicted acyltransferases